MGKIRQGVLGAVSGSVGTVTGAFSSGVPILRKRQEVGTGGHSVAQETARTNFTNKAHSVVKWKDLLILLQNIKDKKGMTIWNQLMKGAASPWSLFTAGVDWSKISVPSTWLSPTAKYYTFSGGYRNGRLEFEFADTESEFSDSQILLLYNDSAGTINSDVFTHGFDDGVNWIRSSNIFPYAEWGSDVKNSVWCLLIVFDTDLKTILSIVNYSCLCTKLSWSEQTWSEETEFSPLRIKCTPFAEPEYPEE